MLQKVQPDHQLQATFSSSSNNLPLRKRPILIEDLYVPGFHINNSNFCPDEGKGMKLLILISTKSDHADLRVTIRKTYGSFNQRRDVGIAFVMCRSKQAAVNEAILQEQQLYDDIIQPRCIDAYRNLTLKMVAMLEWVDTYCWRVRFVLKTDDDVFVNGDYFLSQLEKFKSVRRTMFGSLFSNRPVRRSNYKYSVSKEEYGPDVFPNFFRGPGYFMTADVVGEIYRAILPSVYMSTEDVIIGGILPPKLGIKMVDLKNHLVIFPDKCMKSRNLIYFMQREIRNYFVLWEKLNNPSTPRCEI